MVTAFNVEICTLKINVDSYGAIIVSLCFFVWVRLFVILTSVMSGM